MRPWRALAVAFALLAAPAAAQEAVPARAGEVSFFRIGNGSTAGTYYPIGGIIATAISTGI